MIALGDRFARTLPELSVAWQAQAAAGFVVAEIEVVVNQFVEGVLHHRVARLQLRYRHCFT